MRHQPLRFSAYDVLSTHSSFSLYLGDCLARAWVCNLSPEVFIVTHRLGQFSCLLPSWLGVCALALLCTLLNAVKPLVVDDAAYFYFADQLAKDALDPYGFEM